MTPSMQMATNLTTKGINGQIRHWKAAVATRLAHMRPAHEVEQAEEQVRIAQEALAIRSSWQPDHPFTPSSTGGQHHDR